MVVKKKSKTKETAKAKAFVFNKENRKEEDKKLREESVNNFLTEIMESKDALKQTEALKAWLAMAANMYHYSFGNLCLIFAQKRNASMVNSYERWKKIFKQAGAEDAYIKKGSGIKVFVPMYKKIEDESQPDGFRKSTFFGMGNVFDISDVVNFDLKKFEESKNAQTEEFSSLLKWCISKFEALPYINKISIQKSKYHGYAALHSTKKENEDTLYISDIVLSEELSDADKLRVLFHEAMHAKNHVGRSMGTSKTSHRKSIVEVEAESVAYIISRHLGLNTDDSVFYVASWEGNRETAISSLKRITETAKDFLTILDERNAEKDVVVEEEKPVKKKAGAKNPAKTIKTVNKKEWSSSNIKVTA